MTRAGARRTWVARVAVFALLAAACAASTGGTTTSGADGGGSPSSPPESGGDACTPGATKLGTVSGRFCSVEAGGGNPACCPIAEYEEFTTTNTSNHLRCYWNVGDQTMACDCYFVHGCDGLRFVFPQTSAPDQARLLDLWRTYCPGVCDDCDGGACNYADSTITPDGCGRSCNVEAGD